MQYTGMCTPTRRCLHAAADGSITYPNTMMPTKIHWKRYVKKNHPHVRLEAPSFMIALYSDWNQHTYARGPKMKRYANARP